MRKSKLFVKSPIICEPRENMSITMYLVGWLSRALVHFACVFGSCLFLADSFGITAPIAEGGPKASILILALSCIFVSACTSAAAFNKTMLAIVPPAGIAAFLLLLCAWGNPISLVRDGVACVWDTAIYRMASAGYYGFSSYATTSGYAFSQTLCLNVGMAVVAMVFGVIFGLCLIRRGKLIPTAIVCVAILVPIFTYNLTRTNAGMTAAIVYIVSALSMSLYDRRYSGKEFNFIKRRDKKLAKKAKKAEKKAEKRAYKLLLKTRAKNAYESALDLSGDKKIAKAAKNAVYTIVEEEEKKAKEAAKEEKQKQKREKKRTKKQAKLEKKKAKKEKAKADRKQKKLAKKDKALAKRLAEEKKSAAKAKAKDKKARIAEKRRVQHETNERKRYNIAAGGFAGLCAVACALTSVWLPAVVISGKFPEIPLINGPMSTARAYVSAYLSGDDVDLNDLNMYGNLSELAPRTLSFDPLEFEGTQIFAVTTDGQYPIYLKSWMGRSFDEETGTWLGADSDQVIEFRSEFGKTFTPDYLKTELYKYLLPSSTLMYANDAYMSFEKNGFAVGHVNVRRINSTSKIVFIPATMNTDYAIMGYNNLAPIDYKYSYFYDGIYSSRFFDVDVPYSTASFITTLKHPQVGNAVYAAQEYIDLALDYIALIPRCEETIKYREGVEEGEYTDVETELGTFRLSSDDFSALDAAFTEEVKARGLDYFQKSLVLQYLEMDEEGKTAFHEYIELEKKYAEFAMTAYGEPFTDEDITALAAQLLKDAHYRAVYDHNDVLIGYVDGKGNDVSDHDVIMTAINYLRNNYTYTLTPTAPAEVTTSVLNSFLFDTKEGYCTHFATAAAALIRAYGYPVRFCEGYIAPEFNPDYSAGAASDYISYVHDDNAHAWIEVYLDTLGWSQYETTPEYAEPMYDSDYDFPSPDMEIETTPPSEEEEIPEETTTIPETEAPEETEMVPPGLVGPSGDEEGPSVNYTRIALVVGIFAAICAVIYGIGRLARYFLVKMAAADSEKRLAIVREGLSETRRLKTPESNRDLALELNDLITRCMKISGLEPVDGEGRVEFAERVAEYYGGITETPIDEIIKLMLKAEFGRSMDSDEVYILADFADRFVRSVYDGLDPMRKFWWRYIKRLI